MLARLEDKGVLIADSTLPGEGRAAGAVPAHPNGIQVSRHRWLLLYATRRFRGVDDDCSIVWQLRSDSPVGAVIKEGLFARATSDWDVLGDGRVCVRQHGHPVAFGVPKGATVGGRPAPSANLFVAKWRRVGRLFDRRRNLVVHARDVPEVGRRTQAVEWLQFRLSDAEDDIEIVEPGRVLRQEGFEEGERFTSAEGIGEMNQSFSQAVPFNADGTEWADANCFDHRHVAALKYRFNRATQRYEWVETGPLMTSPVRPLMEGTLVPVGDGTWVIAARTEGSHASPRNESPGIGAAWVRTGDPFLEVPAVTFTSAPLCNGPLTVYRCPDGIVRMFAGDTRSSPYGRSRDPLYCWEIDPDTFAASNQRVVFDTVAAGLPFRKEAVPIADMCKLLQHQGHTQYLVHRVRVRAIDHPYIAVLLDEVERAHSAIYHAELTYDQDYPGPWRWD